MSKQIPGSLRSAPGYWRTRLFRNTYTRDGRRREVRGWRVKIQDRGRRVTYRLKAEDRDAAAREALDLFRSLRDARGTHVGGDGMGSGGEPVRALDPSEVGNPGSPRLRLVRRPYLPTTPGNGGWSVWLERDGQGHYFPLGTEDPGEAERRARRLQLQLIREGMEWLVRRHPREATVAIRWCADPVMWSYCSLHTTPGCSASASRRKPVSLSVAVVEPDPALGSALVSCLNAQPGWRVIGAWEKAAEALGIMGRQKPDLILVNQTLDGIPGADFVARLRQLEPGLAAVVYSVCVDSDELFKSTPGGAVGYLLRRTPSDRVLEPLEGPSFAGRPDSTAMAVRVRRYFQQLVGAPVLSGGSATLSRLTPRELEILALMSKGFLDKEIAHDLRISVWTVHGHAKKIYEKLGVHSRTEAVVRYLQK
ncbi:MAG: response regulator transcription factor [Verrucomicrobiales bacterium]|nr:response regulator transcription factor [Verrucomicrobiales bacterium]